MAVTRAHMRAHDLPHEGHEPVPDAFAVFRISGQVSAKETLFIKEPPQQKRQHCPEYDEPPVRAQRQRRSKEVQQGARVHRVTDA
ncbi:MAG: hypothetical protein JWO04_5011 [Gammaproteobacteria bacterium]|nr:hypothetical protein [Gammaproteobacteria bacterium]